MLETPFPFITCTVKAIKATNFPVSEPGEGEAILNISFIFKYASPAYCCCFQLKKIDDEGLNCSSFKSGRLVFSALNGRLFNGGQNILLLDEKPAAVPYCTVK